MRDMKAPIKSTVDSPAVEFDSQAANALPAINRFAFKTLQFLDPNFPGEPLIRRCERTLNEAMERDSTLDKVSEAVTYVRNRLARRLDVSAAVRSLDDIPSANTPEEFASKLNSICDLLKGCGVKDSPIQTLKTACEAVRELSSLSSRQEQSDAGPMQYASRARSLDIGAYLLQRIENLRSS